MSWSCESCGGDRNDDHRLCRIEQQLGRIADALTPDAERCSTSAAEVFESFVADPKP